MVVDVAATPTRPAYLTWVRGSGKVAVTSDERSTMSEPSPRTRLFDLSDILTVTTDALVSDRHVEGLYDILNWMTGDNLFTHQLPRAADECKPELLRQHPQLADITPPEFSSQEEVFAWVSEQKQQHGDQLAVAPLPEGDHTMIHPIAELRMMRPDVPIIVIDPSAHRD